MPITSAMYEGLVQHDAQLAKLYMDLKNMSDILKLFPVTDIGRSRVSAQLWDVLPTGGYRDINEQFTESLGSTRNKEDLIAIYGGKFPIDIAFDDYTQEPKLEDPVESQYKMHERSTALELMNDVVNGDVDVEKKGFNGLQKRLENGDQDSANLIKCAAASNLLARQSAANAIAYLEFLDEALMEVGMFDAPAAGDSGSAARGAIFMNKKSFLAPRRVVKWPD